MLTLILSVLLFGGTLVMEWGGLGMIHSWSINTLLDGHRLLQSGGMQFALTVLVFWGVLPLGQEPFCTESIRRGGRRYGIKDTGSV